MTKHICCQQCGATDTVCKVEIIHTTHTDIGYPSAPLLLCPTCLRAILLDATVEAAQIRQRHDGRRN